MLGGDDHLGAADRLAVDVTHGHLALGVGLQVGELAGVALVREHLQDLVREVDRRRHERVLFIDLALGAGEAEHHALVAGAFFLAALHFLGVDAHGDVRRLAVQQHFHVGAVMGEAVLIVADVFHDTARDLGDQLAIDDGFVAVLVEQRRLAAAFAGNDDLVGRGQRLAAETRIHLAVVGNAELQIVFEERVEHCIGNLIADFIRMSFGNRLAGE